MIIEIKNRNLKILGHEYTIKVSNKPLLERSTVAMVCSNTLSIEIAETAPISRQTEGLFHEIIEALNYHLELGMEHNKITALSEGLYQVFADNFFKGQKL